MNTPKSNSAAPVKHSCFPFGVATSRLDFYTLQHTETGSCGATMNSLIKLLVKAGLLTPDLDYRLLRISMIVIFVLFGYQKWFTYEASSLIPYISHGPLISWMYPVFGIRGASWFLGVSAWLIATLLKLGFWNNP